MSAIFRLLPEYISQVPTQRTPCSQASKNNRSCLYIRISTALQQDQHPFYRPGRFPWASLQPKCSASILDYGYAINIKRVAETKISYQLRKGKSILCEFFSISRPLGPTHRPDLLRRVVFHKGSTILLLFDETPYRCFLDSPDEQPNTRENYCSAKQAEAL